jgi:hypothetical protein
VAAAIVTIICIAMIVVGGMTLSQGILTSTDSAAISVESISVREGDIMRTDIEILRAAELTWGDDLRITVKNSGQTKLASYDKWDLIVTYEDGGGELHSSWLPYTTGAPANNEWEKAGIGLNGPYEYFEPGILNPGEEMVLLARLDPLPGDATNADISITTPNGVYKSFTLVNPGFLRLTPQAEYVTIGGIKYYELAEATPADGPAFTAGTIFGDGETGRKLLYDNNDATRAARFVYPLTGIDQIATDNWTFTYHALASSSGVFPQTDTDVCFNVDIIIRQANGAIRQTITTGAASAFMTEAGINTWVTVTGSYVFPGYTVIDDSDYLEIVFYGQTESGPSGSTGTLQINIDDKTLPAADQTRIEAD